jgi:hypothetical protein
MYKQYKTQQMQVHTLPKHPHITKQVKTTTVQDIPKWNSHNIIQYPQYKVTLMYLALLSPTPSPLLHFTSLHFKIKSLHINHVIYIYTCMYIYYMCIYFFLMHAQTGSKAHPASCTVVTGSLPGLTRPGRGDNHPSPSSAEIIQRVEINLCCRSGT